MSGGELAISRIVLILVLVMFAVGISLGVVAWRASITAEPPPARSTPPAPGSTAPTQPAVAAPSTPPAPADPQTAPPPAPPTPPPAAVSAKPSAVKQGDVVLVTVEGTGEAAEVSVVITGPGSARETHRAFVSEGSARVLVPVGVTRAPGSYKVDAVAGDLKVIPAALTVEKKEFPSSRITVDKKTVELTQDQARVKADQEKVKAARSRTSPEPLWNQPFTLPVDAPMGTPFGFIRYVNGVEWGRHWGIDFGARDGAPVRAANAGRVVLAEALLLSGNTIIVDHGLNVFTSYLHLSRVDVKAGGTVKRGDVIGRVGSTGFSTGSHLHWSATVGASSINPLALLGL